MVLQENSTHMKENKGIELFSMKWIWALGTNHSTFWGCLRQFI